MITRAEFRRFHWPIFLAAVLLTALGVLFISSASFRSGAEGTGAYSREPAKQACWALVGLAACALAVFIDYRTLRRHAYTLYAVLLGFLVLVLVTGRVRGMAGWFRLGPVGLQPSEFMKVAYLLAIARYLMSTGGEYRHWRGLILPFLIALVPMGLILKQPDFGTALMFLPVLFVVLAVAGARRRHLATIACLGLLSLPVAWYAGLINNQQKARVYGFLYEGQPERIRAISRQLRVRFDTYQQRQSILTVGSGQVFGKGWGKGAQTHYDFLPEDHTDFILSVIGEEAGFVGTTFVLVLYLVIALGGLAIARRTREPFGRLVAIGVVALITTQAAVNAAVATGLMPVTGLTLPFVSYGGSSLVASFMAVGLLLNVGMRRTEVIAARDEFEFDD
jgi:rod shape determining protein RodA